MAIYELIDSLVLIKALAFQSSMHLQFWCNANGRANVSFYPARIRLNLVLQYNHPNDRDVELIGH